MKFMVTLKLLKRLDHDPYNKKTGPCPANPTGVCTDTTGEHHTILWEDDSLEDALSYWRDTQFMHVTRIEEV